MSMPEKICGKCKIIKFISDFSKRKNDASGVQCTCKECSRSYAKDYYKKNKKKIINQVNAYQENNKDKTKKDVKVYYTANRKKILIHLKKYYHLNKETILKKSKHYQKANREKINVQRKKASATNPKKRLNHSISDTMRGSLKGNKSGVSWLNLIDYTFDDLKRHLEKQFKKGMTWDNYGKAGWEIDHIIPISVFNFSKPEHEDFKRCWALKNLQPMWGKDNASKKDKLSKHFQPSLLL